MERGAVRLGRRAARTGARALSGAALALSVAAASAAAQPWSSGVGDPGASTTDPNPIAWWSVAGRPGGGPAAWFATGDPPALAGLAVGGFDLDEPMAPNQGPWPGIPAARRALVWSDSLAVIALPDPGTTGFGVPLLALRTVNVARSSFRTRAVVGLGEGSDAWDDNGLAVERGDSLQGFRAEVMTGSRGVTGSLGDASRRLWDVSGRMMRGSHQLRVAYRQQGASGHLPLGLGQSAEGESGRIAWRWEHRGWWTDLRAARGDDHHQSSGDTLAGSRRDAGATTVEAEVGGVQLGGITRATVSAVESDVRRITAEVPEFDRDAHAAWVSLAHQRAFAGGRLDGSLGAGRHDAVGGTRLAPWVAWQRPLLGGTARLSAGRWLAPMWSDLAPGQGAFVQSTWAGAAQWAADRRAWHGDALVIAGRTRDPALVARLPLEDLWLRQGVRAGDLVHFTLVSGGVSVTGGAWSAGTGGFALARGDDGGPRVDPRWGGRAFARWRGALFQGDLGVALQATLDALGARQADGPGRPEIPSYGSLGASAVLTLADATVVIEAKNLEGTVRAEPWIDPSTGAPALGPGRELRFALRLKLYN